MTVEDEVGWFGITKSNTYTNQQGRLLSTPPFQASMVSLRGRPAKLHTRSQVTHPRPPDHMKGFAEPGERCTATEHGRPDCLRLDPAKG